MKALILTAGYAVRMYPLTLDKPKALLPIGARTVLDLIVEKIESVAEIDETIILSNQKFLYQFESWLAGRKLIKPTRIITDGSTSEEDKLGAVGDLAFSIKEENIRDDLLVLAGDNIFDFNLNDFISCTKEKYPSAVISLHDVRDFEAAKRYGVVEIDRQDKVISVEEKPENPKSTLVSMCLYFFPKETLTLIFDYLAETKNPDQTGCYIRWLLTKIDIYSFYFQGMWYDIGNIKTYQKAREELAGK